MKNLRQIKHWAFLTHVSNMYAPTEIGSWYSESSSLARTVQRWNVSNCLEAQQILNDNDAEFAAGFGCRNETEVMQEINNRATNDFVVWFFEDASRCGITVDAAFALTGVGVARSVVKYTTRQLFKKARQGASKEEIIFAAEEYAKTQNTLGAAGALVGVVFGETVNDAVCTRLEKWALEQLDSEG